MTYVHLNEKDRVVIHHLTIYGLSYREIGRRLNRHHTTISREIKRNWPYPSVYWPEKANKRATERKHIARHAYKRHHKNLYRYVVCRLKRNWLPETISACIRLDYPADDSMRICAEAIYHWVYWDAKQGGALHHCLRRRRKRRRKHSAYGSGRGLFPDRMSISERPDIVEKRNRVGDWEGDTMEGGKGTAHIATHVDRFSRYLIAVKLSDKQAHTMATQTIKAFRKVPARFRKTLTLDNGKEFAQFLKMEKDLEIDIYFSDPYSPWERGTNENTNGVLRQYFPKGTDLRKISDKDLADVVYKFNIRPRKSLNYLTPHQ